MASNDGALPARHGARQAPNYTLYGVIAFLVSFCLMLSISTIPAGYCGVVDLFGTVSKNTLAAGFNLRKPFARVVRFSLQTQLLEFHEDVPTNEGLTVGLDVSVLYRLEPQSVRGLYINVGSKYQEVLVMPETRSAIRDLTGKTNAKALYSEGREGLSKDLNAELNERLGKRGIVVEQVMLRSVRLPEQLQQAIQLKLRSEQESQRMEFVLTKEKQEAERKRIEAKGISDFQHIVSQGISAQLLEWKGIEATEKLAASSNSKIVMFGNPQNGLPTILGGLGGLESVRQQAPARPVQGGMELPPAGDLMSDAPVNRASANNRRLLAVARHI